MDNDEKKIADILFSKSLRVEEFTKEETRDSKSPDFRVFKNNVLVFFCEVKTISHDEWSDGARNDPVFNRISNKIHEAVQQFDAINPTLEYPNVLAFVNHDNMCDSLDLVAVTTGHFLSEEGGRHPIYLQFSEGRIKEEKFRIHLYIWIDEFKGNRYLFNTFTRKHLDNLCNYFGINSNAINNVLGESQTKQI
jgi:hypothetical protein